jgi:hypothetical protein
MKYAFLLLLIGLISGCANHYPVKVGDETVVIKQHQNGDGKAFVHLHQNETTALKAAKAVIKAEGGSLLTLAHSGERNIVFHLDNKRYEFDPNRIFTDPGIQKTLVDFGNYSPKAHAEVKKLASKIKALLPKDKKIIAVHNNQSYSLKNYLPGHELAADAKALNVNTDSHYRNFYLVTKKVDYQRLKELNFNSILQALNASDDGSLSVYLANSDYVNVEAGFDQLAAQINMLKHA